MIGQFGYAQSGLFPGATVVPQRVIGVPIQSVGLPGQYGTVPIEALTPRIIPTTALFNPQAVSAYPSAYWQTAPFFGGVTPYGAQALPAQQVFGLPQAGIQVLPASQIGLPQAGIQGLPVSQICFVPVIVPMPQALGAQVQQVPHALGGLPLQTVSWGGPMGFDPTSHLVGFGHEFLPTAQAQLPASQALRGYCI